MCKRCGSDRHTTVWHNRWYPSGVHRSRDAKKEWFAWNAAKGKRASL